MTNKIYQEYIDIYIGSLKDYTDKGYEIIQVYSENTGFTQDKQIHGTFMGNSVSLYIPVYQPSVTTKILMGRTNAARILYEEKLNANKPGNP